MNPETGAIEKVVNADDAKKRGLIPIAEKDLPMMRRMNRRQRRAWAVVVRKNPEASFKDYFIACGYPDPDAPGGM